MNNEINKENKLKSLQKIKTKLLQEYIQENNSFYLRAFYVNECLTNKKNLLSAQNILVSLKRDTLSFKESIILEYLINEFQECLKKEDQGTNKRIQI